MVLVTEIGDLVLKANALRNEAWQKERAAITQLEQIIERGSSNGSSSKEEELGKA